MFACLELIVSRLSSPITDLMLICCASRSSCRSPSRSAGESQILQTMGSTTRFGYMANADRPWYFLVAVVCLSSVLHQSAFAVAVTKFVCCDSYKHQCSLVVAVQSSRRRKHSFHSSHCRKRSLISTLHHCVVMVVIEIVCCDSLKHQCSLFAVGIGATRGIHSHSLDSLSTAPCKAWCACPSEHSP